MLAAWLHRNRCHTTVQPSGRGYVGQELVYVDGIYPRPITVQGGNPHHGWLELEAVHVSVSFEYVEHLVHGLHQPVPVLGTG